MHFVKQIATEQLQNLTPTEISVKFPVNSSQTIPKCYKSFISDIPLWSHVPSRWNMWKMIGLWAWTALGALIVTASEKVFGNGYLGNHLIFSGFCRLGCFVGCHGNSLYEQLVFNETCIFCNK